MMHKAFIAGGLFFLALLVLGASVLPALGVAVLVGIGHVYLMEN